MRNLADYFTGSGKSGTAPVCGTETSGWKACSGGEHIIQGKCWKQKSADDRKRNNHIPFRTSEARDGAVPLNQAWELVRRQLLEWDAGICQQKLQELREEL